jgi:hypothetical protein
MRKFVLAAVTLVCSVGLTLAADVVFVSYDKEKKELKVKDKEDKETTYKITDKVTFKTGEKDTPADKGIARLERMEGNEKAKGKAKFKITAEGSELKEVQFPEGKKKDKQ